MALTNKTINQLHTEQLSEMTVAEILSLHAAISETLRERGIVRSANNPTGDLAEFLFCTAFGWTQAPNSEKGYDAADENGKRYQIKGRRLHRRTNSRQLSAIRNLSAGHFDVLAGILFDDAYRIQRAALIPIGVVRERSVYNKHTNSNLFMLQDSVWQAAGVRDVTDALIAAMP